jgi:hypothetical protein
MAFSWDNFKQLKCYRTQSYKGTQAQRDKGKSKRVFLLCAFATLSLKLAGSAQCISLQAAGLLSGSWYHN